MIKMEVKRQMIEMEVIKFKVIKVIKFKVQGYQN